MYTRSRKTACIAIVIMLLMSEIYLNMVMTDSFFVYKSTGESNIFFQSNSVDFIFGKASLKNDSRHLDRGICTTNMLSECAGIELQSAGWNWFLSLLHIGYLFLLQGKFFQLSEIIQTYYQTLEVLVIEYMHQSDGKKRGIPLFYFST
ncbi:MAG TPA: hypothetical protein DEB74_11350 [Lachnospiraceae bacterium]|nr:hypothetical protein [Lachnospiraceae bacterium]